MNDVDTIILIKLINSEQYIGTLTEEDEQGIRLENPLRIATIYTSETSQRPDVIILPWNELSKMQTVYFDKLHIMYYTIPKDNIVEFYNKQTQKYSDNVEEDDVTKALVEKSFFNPTIN